MINHYLLLYILDIGIYDPELEVDRFKKYYLPDWDMKDIDTALPGLSKVYLNNKSCFI